MYPVSPTHISSKAIGICTSCSMQLRPWIPFHEVHANLRSSETQNIPYVQRYTLSAERYHTRRSTLTVRTEIHLTYMYTDTKSVEIPYTQRFNIHVHVHVHVRKETHRASRYAIRAEKPYMYMQRNTISKETKLTCRLPYLLVLPYVQRYHTWPYIPSVQRYTEVQR